MTLEPIPESPLSLPVAIIGGGMVAAFVGTLIFYPVIDRFIRNRFRLSRGQAMALLLACALCTGILGGGVTYLMFHDDPRYRTPEEDPADGPPARAAQAAPPHLHARQAMDIPNTSPDIRVNAA